MASSLEDLIDEFVAEGYEPEDAARAAMLVLKKRREGSAIQRSDSSDRLSLRADGGGVPERRIDGSLDLGTARGLAINNGDRRPVVDYGNETPQEAGARWAAQEMMDPNGVFSTGGLTGGGIFGGGAVATERYDPEAHHRAAATNGALAPAMQAEVMMEMLSELRQMRAERGELPPRRTAEHFIPGRGPARQLAAKKPR